MRPSRLFPALACLLLSAAAARASPLPPDQVEWSYDFTPGAIFLPADGNPLAGVTFTNEPTKVTHGTSEVLATSLRTTSGAPGFAADPPAFDTLTDSGAYSLRMALSLVEDGSVFAAELDFTGKLGGYFSFESTNLTNDFGPDWGRTVWLGPYRFEVTPLPFTPPGPQDQFQPGEIAARVEVSGWSPWGDAGGPEWYAVPEPATLVSSLLGLACCLGGAACRRRRASPPAAGPGHPRAADGSLTAGPAARRRAL